MDDMRQITIPLPCADELYSLARDLGISPEATAETILSMSLADHGMEIRGKLMLKRPRGYVNHDALKACAVEGLTATETALRLGVAKTTVWRHTRRAGVFKWGRRSYAHPRCDEAMAALRAGCKTAVDIAKQIGPPRPNVLQALYRLEDAGRIHRAGTQARASTGRALVCWRIAAAA